VFLLEELLRFQEDVNLLMQISSEEQMDIFLKSQYIRRES